jgi:hypothetical protein
MTDMPDALKSCSKCRLEKPMDEFNRFSRTRDGRQSYCRACSSAANRPATEAKSAERAARRKARDDRPDQRCPGCEQWVPRSGFAVNKASRSGLQTYCRPCSAERQRKYKEANREAISERRRALYAANAEELRRKRREYAKAKPEIAAKSSRKLLLRKKYGLTEEMFEAMVKAQGGCCAICEQQFDRQPHVDHCHATGPTRALLCSKCNTALGLFDDDPSRMEAAIAYVERFRAMECA